ncbi:MAG: hypothetical protein J7480_09760, partial [Microbacteriaceae bacterium]|nr:hypothetical protein [Microbacteriaceae bacterium]
IWAFLMPPFEAGGSSNGAVVTGGGEIVAAFDRGLGLRLGVRPGGELRPGIRVGVDVPTSGFAFLCYALLGARGLRRDDVEIVALGSTPKRLEALLAGDCDATILNAGNELRGAAAGAGLLGSTAEVGPYLGTVLARLTDSAQPEAVDRLAAVLTTTAAEIVAGAHREIAIAAAADRLGLDAELAAAHADVLRDPVDGLVADGLVDGEALITMTDLRRRYLPVPELDGLDPRGAVRAGRLR